MLDASKLVGLLAEPERRRVVAALILSSGELSEVADTAGLDSRTTYEALNRLMAAGLVEVSSDGVYVLLEEAFKAAARSTDSNTPDDSVDDGMIGQYIVDGRLDHLPRKRAKRLVVLDHLAQLFEPGVHYSEREVNATLRRYHDDVATLRRYLVDEYFLDRASGEYWRSGGSVTEI